MRALAHIHTWILSHAPAEREAERGASLVEYALMMALIAMVCIAAVTALGATTSDSFSVAVSKLD